MLGLIMVIAIIFDISEKIDDFLEKEAPIKAIVFDYYVNFVLHYGNLFNFMLIFISVIFFTAKMAQNTEIVAILSSGVSFRRLLLPYFIGATVLASISFYMNHWVLPEANKVRLEFEEQYIRNKAHYSADFNIHKVLQEGENIYIRKFRLLNNRGYKFALEQWNGTELTNKIIAQSISWDSTKQKWVIEGWRWRKINGMEETLERGRVIDTVLNMHPSDFASRINKVEAMNSNELDAYIEEKRKEGSDYVPFYEIEKHQRSSYPFATYILTLIGVSVASRKVRGGIGLHIAFGLLMCGIYILCMKITSVFATNAGVNTMIAVWIPNLVFGIVAIVLFNKAHK